MGEGEAFPFPFEAGEKGPREGDLDSRLGFGAFSLSSLETIGELRLGGAGKRKVATGSFLELAMVFAELSSTRERPGVFISSVTASL